MSLELKNYIFYQGNKLVNFEKNNYVYSNESSYYWGSPGTITIGTTIRVQSNNSSSGRGAKAVSSSPIDLTNLTTLYVNITQFSGNGIHSFTITKNKNDYSNGSSGPIAKVAITKIGQYSVNCSSLTGNYYISLSCMSNLSDGTNSMTCDAIWTNLSTTLEAEEGATLIPEVNANCSYNISCEMARGYSPAGFYKDSVLLERNTPLLAYTETGQSTILLKTEVSGSAMMW